MKSKFFLSILAISLLAGSARAQYTGNNQTNTISGVASNWVPDSAYIVGDTYVYDALVIQNGGVLSNYLGFIGNQPGADYNTALVTGSGSVWSNISTLYVGDSGAGNSLTIASSGTVYNGNGYIGYQPGASNNTVLVTGRGSVWVNGLGTNILALFVGYSDAGNSLTITSGGTVYNGYGYIGSDYGASNNTVLVSGSGSVWSNSGAMNVGYSGGGNSLTITNGGTVYNGSAGVAAYDGFVGYASDSNTVLVSGSGSVWSNASDLYVGSAGSGNSLTIASSGTVFNANGFIGYAADDNTVLVSGSGSVWNNLNHLYVGSNGVGNSLTITNGATVSNGNAYIGYASGANNNTALITGSGSSWRPAYVYVGYSGAGNSLTIANGATVNDIGGYIYIGYQPGADNNTFLVSGSGSVWLTSSLQVGYYGAGNSLVISNGGSVLCSDYGLTIGVFDGSSNNAVVVADGGSLAVTNADGDETLYVSYAGADASLVLSGGTVTVNQLYLANGSNSFITFNAGTLNSGGTIVTGPYPFFVGDGTDAAVFHLLGGEHSFVYNDLEISSNAFLTGCGDINGYMTVDVGGTVLADCGGTLTFSDYVDNNGTVLVLNGSVLEANGEVDNYGLINAFNGIADFQGGLDNYGVVLIGPGFKGEINSYANGCVLTEREATISSITRSDNNIIVQIPSGSCGTYQLQVSPSLHPATWTNLGASQSATGALLTFTDTGGATNRPSRFYHIDITLP